MADLTENFGSSSLDPAKWVTVSAYGISCGIENGKLIINGTRSGGGDWANHDTWSHIETVDKYGPGIEIEFKDSVGGFGTGYGSGISLYQDAGNHIDIGQIYDPGAGTNTTLSRGGQINGAWLSGVRLDTRPIDSSVMRTIKVVYSHNQTAEIFVDGDRVGTYSFDLNNFTIRFYGHTRQSGDQIRALIDDISVKELASSEGPTDTCEECPSTLSDFWLYVLIAIVIGEFTVIVALLSTRQQKTL